PVHGVGFDDKGRLMATAAWDHRNGQKMWEVASGVDRSASYSFVPLIRSIGFSPDGRKMVSGDFDGHVRIRDLQRNVVVNEFQAHDDAVWCSTYRPDGSLFVTGGGHGRLRFWDAKDGRPLATIAGAQPRGVRSLCFSPDGKLLASGGVDGTAKIWDVEAILQAGAMPPTEGPATESMP